MADTKRAWKLQEFQAHGSDVNCVGLGPRSVRVMVTGGEDYKVNIWSVGKAHCIMSLSGHTTGVQAVRFRHSEEMVVAGSRSGTLKIWDLEQAKIVRTLTGHKAGIKSLDFHPHGDYAASGSLDCNVKLWDIRRKGCIYTYKGHSGCINSLRFSPDGRWIASASDDSQVKVWDLTAGKLLTDLKQHTQAITALEFHPHELLLATASADKTVKFWDLETFQLVTSTEASSTAPRCIAFHPDGICLYAGSKDSLHVYGWEPVRCYDKVSVAWGEVCDISISDTQLIGASVNKSSVASFVVDLEKVGPLGGTGDGQGPVSGNLSSSRKSFVLDNSSAQANEPKKEEEAAEKVEEPEESSGADIKNPEEYRQLFQAGAKPGQAAPDKLQKFLPPGNGESKAAGDAFQQNKASRLDKAQSIHAEDFLPKQPAGPVVGLSSEEELRELLWKGHNPMMTVLSGRSRNLQIVRAMWSSGNTRSAVDAAISMKDPAVLVDVLNVLILKTSLWNLDLCTSLLPHLRELLHSKYESYVVTAGQAVKVVLRNMGQTIKSNMVPAANRGVDIAREERQKKCAHCHRILMDIRSTVQKRSDPSARLAGLYKEILLLSASLD